VPDLAFTQVDPAIAYASTMAHDTSADQHSQTIGHVTALGVTLAAPLPTTTGDGAPHAGATTLSVLPRIEVERDAVRLVPTSGPRYKAVRALGAGGMGEVELVEDRDIGRTVALKRLFGQTQGPVIVARFVDEVRTIGNLEHPNIVPIHDVGVDEHGRYFFVMKFVEGETLETVIEKLQRGDRDAVATYGVQRRIEIFMGLLRALQYAHARGIVHRDVKPANVMIGKYGEIVLMDWGIARPIGTSGAGTAATPGMSAAEMKASPSRASETHHGELIGTPLYMSPEQAAGRNAELDARSDLYSAVVLFHELLGLQHLRHGKTSLAELLVAVQTEDPPSFTSMFSTHASNPRGVAPELAHFVRRGLARNPNHRWQSADEMIFELEGILEGRCRVQCLATFSKRMTREAGRFVDSSPRLAIGSFGLAALLVLALAANAIRDFAF
jgi:serine/threonine-protein kinase